MRIRALAVAAALAACGPQKNPNEEFMKLPQQPTDDVAIGLTSFTGPTACVDLEQHIENRAVFEMRVQVEQQKKWALEYFDYRNNPGGVTQDAGASATGGSSGAGGGTGANAGGPTDFTTTNTQEQGIDEPDIIKNDGTRLFVISGRKLFAATTWPATALSTRGSVEIGGSPFELFLDGNRAVVFSNLVESQFGLPSWCQHSDCSRWYSNATLVTHLDVSNLDQPVVIATQRVPGRYQSARRVGPTMRLVTSSAFFHMDGLRTWLDYETQREADTKAELAGLFDQLADLNEGILRRRTLDQWLPNALLTSGGSTTTTALDCQGIWTTNASARLGLTSIVSLDMNDPLAFSRQALLASVDELYQGPESLYLAQRHWWWFTSTNNSDQTYLYRFDLSQADRVSFVAAGHLAGRPLNQFAFDEHQGTLRVATTVTTTSANFGWNTVNRVVTLGTQNSVLTELGRTDDLAPGERIMSARFIGDTAYVVTFRQVDPLYVIDLSNPAQPRKVGELKIPGFSSYIHPLDATHLLTIGTYIPEPPAQSWTRHLQLQIFDVSNPAAPRQTHTQFVGEAYGWSEAQWNHKAFNYFAAKGLLAVPFADWYQDPTTQQWRFVSDLRVYGVDANAGFTFKGAIDMGDVLRRDWCAQGCWSWYWEPNVRRSVMADDFVYAVSSGGVRVANVNDLTAPLATALFDPAP